MFILSEPGLVFRYDQTLEDPRDGLTLFGPLKENSPYGIHYGIVGTEVGISRFYRWVKTIQGPLAHSQVSKRTLWVPFPGFEAVFGIPFSESAVAEKVIDSKSLKLILREDDPYQRVYNAVNLYSEPILDFYKKADEAINLWFIISPNSVFKECRPKSVIDDPITRISDSIVNKRKEMAKLSKSRTNFYF